MAPVPYGELVKNEIQPGRPRAPRKADETAVPAESRERKKTRVGPDPYASLRAQMAELEKNPEKLMELSQALPKGSTLPPPPELVANVQGSSAGAGSGEFHVYKQARRREMERTKMFEDEIESERVQGEFEARRKMIEKADAERTEKRREKRRKRGKGRSVKDEESKDSAKTEITEEIVKEVVEDTPEVKEPTPVDGEITLTIIDDFEM